MLTREINQHSDRNRQMSDGQMDNEQFVSTMKHRHEFQENGFVRIEQFVSDNELDLLRTIYDETVLRETHYTPEQMALFPQEKINKFLVWLRDPDHKTPALRQTQLQRSALELCSRVLDLSIDNTMASWRMFFKPGNHGCETPWHQDAAHRPGDYPSINVWVTLDPASLESGCMHYLPGTHRGEIVPHVPNEADPTGLSLRAASVDASDAVACPLDPGGAVAHHCRTLHYSRPNTTVHSRRAFVLVCHAKDVV